VFRRLIIIEPRNIRARIFNAYLRCFLIPVHNACTSINLVTMLPFTRDAYFRIGRKKGLTDEEIKRTLPKDATFKDEAARDNGSPSPSQVRNGRVPRRIAPQLPTRADLMTEEAKEALVVALAYYTDAVAEVGMEEGPALASIRLASTFLVPQPQRSTIGRTLFSSSRASGLACDHLLPASAETLSKIVHPSITVFFVARVIAEAQKQTIRQWSRLDMLGSNTLRKARQVAKASMRVSFSKFTPAPIRVRAKRLLDTCLPALYSALLEPHEVSTRLALCAALYKLHTSRLAYVCTAYEPARGVYAVLGDEEEYVVRVHAYASLLHALCTVVGDSDAPTFSDPSSVFAFAMAEGVKALALAGRDGTMMSIEEADAALKRQADADDSSDSDADSSSSSEGNTDGETPA